jgi:hypothetical protein
MNEPLLSLDDLFKEAKRQIRTTKAAKAEAPPPDPQRLYTDPENWTQTRGVALIHAETETLLGNFSEYVHKSVAGCRRLVREEGPLSVSVAERVSGSWWIAASIPEIEPRQEWHTRHSAVLAVQLPRLGVHLPICEVTACLSYGGIARVELAMDSMFAQLDGSPEALLFLPAGTDILGEMNTDSKIALRLEIGEKE